MSNAVPDIAHLATLAALELDDDERRSLAADLEAIVGYVELLQAVPTDDVPAMTTVVSPAPRIPLREDAAAPSLTNDEALANAPEAEGGGFVVPTFVGSG